jgi:CDP-glucose 4,6-dehydratase
MKNLKVFKNSKVIVTGHTGFKGSWLTAWLKYLGADVMGISLDPNTSPSHFVASKIGKNIKNIKLDIRNRKKLEKKIVTFKPDFIFHLAAQALVGLSYKNSSLTWESNVFGTLNLLESIKKLKNKCNVVIITSDKCYFNRETHSGYKETDILGGKDPYSASKASAEILVHSYIMSFFSKQKIIRITTARAGNVIGGGDWSNNRIIPDCIKSWSKNKTAKLRNPDSTRPWQHVIEAVGGYLCLAVNLKFNKKLHGESFNFGPSLSKEYSVLDLVKKMSNHWKNTSWKKKSKSQKKFYESGLLRLNCNKAKKLIKWKSILKFDELTLMVVEWYRNYYLNKQNASQVTHAQIKKYQHLAIKRGLKWAIIKS